MKQEPKTKLPAQCKPVEKPVQHRAMTSPVRAPQPFSQPVKKP
jgi:hypothetical protein